MADVHSSETRSYNMSRIRNKDTKPEELVRKYLFSKGSAIGKTMPGFQGNRTSFFPNIKRWFL